MDNVILKSIIEVKGSEVKTYLNEGYVVVGYRVDGEFTDTIDVVVNDDNTTYEDALYNDDNIFVLRKVKTQIERMKTLILNQKYGENLKSGIEIAIKKAAERKVEEMLSGDLEFRVNLPNLEIVFEGEVIAECVGGYQWDVDTESSEFGIKTIHYIFAENWVHEYCQSMLVHWGEVSEDDYEDFEDYAALCLRQFIIAMSIKEISEFIERCQVYIEIGEDLDPQP